MKENMQIKGFDNTLKCLSTWLKDKQDRNLIPSDSFLLFEMIKRILLFLLFYSHFVPEHIACPFKSYDVVDFFPTVVLLLRKV